MCVDSYQVIDLCHARDHGCLFVRVVSCSSFAACFGVQHVAEAGAHSQRSLTSSIRFLALPHSEHSSFSGGKVARSLTCSIEFISCNLSIFCPSPLHKRCVGWPAAGQDTPLHLDPT